MQRCDLVIFLSSCELSIYLSIYTLSLTELQQKREYRSIKKQRNQHSQVGPETLFLDPTWDWNYDHLDVDYVYGVAPWLWSHVCTTFALYSRKGFVALGCNISVSCAYWWRYNWLFGLWTWMIFVLACCVFDKLVSVSLTILYSLNFIVRISYMLLLCSLFKPYLF